MCVETWDVPRLSDSIVHVHQDDRCSEHIAHECAKAGMDACAVGYFLRPCMLHLRICIHVYVHKQCAQSYWTRTYPSCSIYTTAWIGPAPIALCTLLMYIHVDTERYIYIPFYEKEVNPGLDDTAEPACMRRPSAAVS
eukprot:jgi/Botrbrau1/7027/Bobra.0165s0052.1